MAIILKVVNPKSGLSKTIDVTNYTREENIKTYSVYTKAGYEVYVIEGIEEMLKEVRL